MGGIEEDGMILQNQRNSSDRRKSGIMLGLVLGNGKERQGQVYFTCWVEVCKGFSRSYDQSAQTLWVWRHGPCNKVRRPFVFPILKQNQKSGFSHVESGNRDTPRFELKNRDIPIKPGWVAGLLSTQHPDFRNFCVDMGKDLHQQFSFILAQYHISRILRT